MMRTLDERQRRRFHQIRGSRQKRECLHRGLGAAVRPFPQSRYRDAARFAILLPFLLNHRLYLGTAVGAYRDFRSLRAGLPQSVDALG